MRCPCYGRNEKRLLGSPKNVLRASPQVFLLRKESTCSLEIDYARTHLACYVHNLRMSADSESRQGNATPGDHRWGHHDSTPEPKSKPTAEQKGRRASRAAHRRSRFSQRKRRDVLWPLLLHHPKSGCGTHTRPPTESSAPICPPQQHLTVSLRVVLVVSACHTQGSGERMDKNSSYNTLVSFSLSLSRYPSCT